MSRLFQTALERLILPIMGAIPDCMVILLSGLQGGTREEIQEQLSVGVGTLVGSTALLLTLPWGIAVFLGRRDYDPVTQRAASTASNKGKYTKFSWTNTCVSTHQGTMCGSDLFLFLRHPILYGFASAVFYALRLRLRPAQCVADDRGR